MVAALPTIAPGGAALSAEDVACATAVTEAKARPVAVGSPGYDRERIGILGRVRGEPLLWMHEPAETPDAALSTKAKAFRDAARREPAGVRIVNTRKRTENDRESRRALLLREGYVFAPDPADAAALVRSLRVADLFDAPEITLQRGAETHTLVRVAAKPGKRTIPATYLHKGGSEDGREADLLLGDRLGIGPLPAPLHRELLGLQDVVGFDRATVAHQSDEGVVLSARFGGVRGDVVTRAEGPTLKPVCTAFATAEDRAKAEAWLAETAPRRAATKLITASITEAVREGLRFDRPEKEETAEHDGELRPIWNTAYLRGQDSFGYLDATYPVFDAKGRPIPPEVCAEFVLDSYERASGTWWAPKGSAPARVAGKLDFDREGVKNRRGVIALAAYAEAKPEFFTYKAIAPKDKIPFGDRARYFADLVSLADHFSAAGIVAIQGRKKDGLIHQHAIFVERTDPLTGFPYGLADQMKKPRRRTWEGIMAEAPLRGLFWIAKPTPALMRRIVGEQRAEVASP